MRSVAMNPTCSSRPRLKYIDIAKGILICCLLYGHMLIIASWEGMDDTVMRMMRKGVPLYNSFFMQTFFLITGFCSSFQKDFKSFLWGNVKSLIIPSIILVTFSKYIIAAVFLHQINTSPLMDLHRWLIDSGPWFILSLFWAKILFYFINKLSLYRQIILIILLYLTGIALNHFDFFPNYWYHRHVLLMLPYLFIGNLCKSHQELVGRYLLPLGVFGVISIVLQSTVLQHISGYKIPTQDVYISNCHFFYIHIINVITGSAFVIWISKKIGSNRFFETMGKGTILVYLWNELVNRLILKILPAQHIYHEESFFSCLLFHCLVFSLVLLSFFFLIKAIYGTKYLSWMVGKW